VKGKLIKVISYDDSITQERNGSLGCAMPFAEK